MEKSAMAASTDSFLQMPFGVAQGERATAGSPVEMVTANGNAVVGMERECQVELGGV